MIQQRKIDQMKLGEYFDDRIYITKHKNIEALEAIISKGNFDRSVTWMIGNSLRTDIEPAISAGIHAIYIEQDVEWQYNVIQLNKPDNYSLYTIKKLVDVPDVIQGYLSGLQN